MEVPHMVHNISICITTCKRPKSTFIQTYKSLEAAGFDQIEYSIDKNIGAWQNWFFGLRGLYETYPDADCYGMVQDDVVFCKGLKAYLNQINLPHVFSVFKPSLYKQVKKGPYWDLQKRGGHLWMAQTLFFSRDSAKSILNHPIVWKVEGNKQIDNRVGLWAEATGRGVYYHSPSLAQHIGEYSALWNDAKLEGDRVADDFVGEDFDCNTLIKKAAISAA